MHDIYSYNCDGIHRYWVWLCFLHSKDLAVADKGAMAGQVEVLKVKYEEALEARKKAELEIEAFRPVSQTQMQT